jgi:glycyl-tRNA synthetase beta chain
MPTPTAYADTAARRDGAVIASFAERRAEIAAPAGRGAARPGGGCRPIEDDACWTR